MSKSAGALKSMATFSRIVGKKSSIVAANAASTSSNFNYMK